MQIEKRFTVSFSCLWCKDGGGHTIKICAQDGMS